MTLYGGDPLRRSLQEAVGGQYEIIRLLGRGAMGAVYLAGDTLERLVAIKVILPAAFADRRTRELFRREMRIVAQFEHPNIVQIYASGAVDDLDWFVMRYVSGDTLAERLKREVRIPPEEARRILVDLADALHYAHGHDIVHRDVKPANVLIDDMTGRAFLTDFGVAKSLNSVTTNSKKTIAGTAGYMPPEAFGSDSVDHRADIYALGVIGYEMLAGRRPFTGDTPLQLIQQTLTAAPPSLSDVAPDVPSDLADAVMGCLAKDPDARARDAQQTRTALGTREGPDEPMPEDITDMAGFGSWTLLWICVWGTFGILKLNALMLGVALLVVALIVPSGFLLQVASMRRAGFRTRQIARVAFWPPKWWGMWWPPQLRRPRDLWPRLPARARLARMALSAFLIIVPLLIFLATPTGVEPPLLTVPLPIQWMIIAVLAGGVMTVLVTAWMWARRQRLAGPEIVRLLIGPTVVSQFWDSHKVASLLRAVARPVAIDVHASPENPRDCHDKIKRGAQLLPNGSRALGRFAMQAAHELLAEVDSLDVEISELAQVSDPASIARIEAGLRELKPSTHDSVMATNRRRALESELAQLRDIDMRLDVARHDRARRVELHRAIWQALVALIDLRPGDPAAERVRERLRRLCVGDDDRSEDMTRGETPGLLGPEFPGPEPHPG